MSMELSKRLAQEARRGAVGAVDQASGKTLMWHRDIGHSWRLIVHEALTAANEAYGQDPEVFAVLTKVSHALAGIYEDSLKDNHKGMSGFRELYDYIQGEGEKAMSAYATFSAFVLQSMFCFMFTGRKLAIGLPQDLDSQQVHEFHSSLLHLSLLDDDTRIDAAKQFRDRGVWPTNIDTSSMLRRLDSFLGVMLEDKAACEKEAKENAAKAKK